MSITFKVCYTQRVDSKIILIVWNFSLTNLIDKLLKNIELNP
ncbi:hypothetical protein M595_2903 [Lyngbya aestuarii BL J]|uniref:Uncharacterized protein n=1 Tax=Lyngbya aestuarii BL J TaxID=1348334 RepID=U7QIR6_9CYAN|nr:hypothetical protein M595_2903 [Lyngbya aestuarii BL J]